MFHHFFAACAIGTHHQSQTAIFQSPSQYLLAGMYRANKMNKQLFHLPENLTSRRATPFV